MSKSPIKVGIVGASGYTALELMRILSQHTHTKLCCVSSTQHQGKSVSALHPNLENCYDLTISSFGDHFFELDAVFVALPHGHAMPIVNELWQNSKNTRIIDLSSDFRLEQNLYQQHYKQEHLYPQLLPHAIYGTTELAREEISSARLIANPGCFAHCIILALAPLALERILPERIYVSAITGSTGSGASLTEKTHHPARNESMFAYQPLTHRHLPEIETTLARLSKNPELQIDLVPHSGPYSRGIFATCFCEMAENAAHVRKLYEQFAAHNHFVRLREDSPKLLEVRGSNFCDLAIKQKDNRFVVLATIDNLVKGAAGNAVQCLNLMFNLPEQTGLIAPSLCI